MKCGEQLALACPVADATSPHAVRELWNTPCELSGGSGRPLRLLDFYQRCAYLLEATTVGSTTAVTEGAAGPPLALPLYHGNVTGSIWPR